MAVTIVQSKLSLEDPHDCTDSSDTLTLHRAFFDTLVRHDGSGFVPHLALGWDVSDDAHSWVFHLRAGVTFHDGSGCDAAAVTTSLERLARADKGYTLGAPGVWHQFLGDAEISAVGDLTVRIVLSSPIADLLDILVQCNIVSPASIEALEAGHTQFPVGSGPYRMVSVSQDELIAEYTGAHFAGAPANRTVRWLNVPQQADRQELLLSGEAQVANDLDFATSNNLATSEFTRHEYLNPLAVVCLLNARRGPLSDPGVRRALSIAIDREDIVARVMHGAAQPLLGFVSPIHFGAGQGASAEPDLTLARDLLAESGFSKGLTLELDCPRRLPDESVHLTQVIAEQLTQIEVTLKIHYHEDREEYAHMIRRKEIRDLCVFDSSPLSTFRVLYEKIDARQEGSWWQGYHNERVENLLDRGRSMIDSSGRANIYRQAYAELQRDPPWLTLYNPIDVVVIKGNHAEFTMPWDGVLDAALLPEVLTS